MGELGGLRAPRFLQVEREGRVKEGGSGAGEEEGRQGHGAGLVLLLRWRSTAAEGRLRSGGLDAGDVTTGEDDGGRGRARAGEALLLEGLGLGRDGFCSAAVGTGTRRWEAAGSSSPWLATRGTGRSAWAVVVGWIGKEEAGRLGMDPEGDFWSGGGRMGMGQGS